VLDKTVSQTSVDEVVSYITGAALVGR
jgi:hypothetical protein